MNNINNAIKDIVEFLKSDKRCMLIKGTNQYKKHLLVIAIIDKYYKNAKILFRSNGVDNAISNLNIMGKLVGKKYKSGELFTIENNYYSIDSFIRKDTWSNSNHKFDFAIIYPIDAIARGDINIDCVKNIIVEKRISKVFLVSWTDHKNDEYKELDNYIDATTTYDVEEEDLEYHKRVLKLM